MLLKIQEMGSAVEVERKQVEIFLSLFMLGKWNQRKKLIILPINLLFWSFPLDLLNYYLVFVTTILNILVQNKKGSDVIQSDTQFMNEGAKDQRS